MFASNQKTIANLNNIFAPTIQTKGKMSLQDAFTNENFHTKGSSDYDVHMTCLPMSMSMPIPMPMSTSTSTIPLDINDDSISASLQQQLNDLELNGDDMTSSALREQLEEQLKGLKVNNDGGNNNNKNKIIPGMTTYDMMPKRLTIRRWKQPNVGHPLEFQNHTGKTKTFGESLLVKNDYQQMKSVEQQLKDEIRQENDTEKTRVKAKQKIKEENERRGLIVTPIRNMHKLRKLTKKQWKSVIKMSVDIKQPRGKNTLRNIKVERIGDA